MTVAGLDLVLSESGWPYASSQPSEPGDRGRFHALFGRDSLISALQILPARPDVAIATLRALATRQGQAHDSRTLEEPGKIGHEFRDRPPDSFLANGWPDERPFRYYGSADATSWFLVLLSATGDDDLVADLEPHWRAALDWLVRTLGAGDGLMRHHPGSLPGGLSQQGWRDARDPVTQPTRVGILRPDGTAPDFPLADTDTQAVSVAALRAAARLTGDPAWLDRARTMRATVTARFLPDAVAVEGDDRAVRGAGSQLGWLLWADAVEPDAVQGVADRLLGADVCTAVGLRTLGRDEPGYDEQAYHRGGIWPFDSWLGWAGLRAAGRVEAAERLRVGVLSAIDAIGGYPELYCATAAGEAYPSTEANGVQAWTIGARWALENRWDGRVA